jgi:hypothetical protein
MVGGLTAPYTGSMTDQQADLIVTDPDVAMVKPASAAPAFLSASFLTAWQRA